MRSFKDSNGDGIGDLQGLLERLDYLHWLGVTIVWLTPIYPSPQCDFGYDISNYTDIDQRFGSLEASIASSLPYTSVGCGWCWISCRITPRSSILGSSSRAARAPARSAIGTCGRILR